MRTAGISGQTCDCNGYPGYECIGSGTLRELIDNDKLLDYAEAQTDPQYIVVESDINFLDPQESAPYHFAPGSHIIMLQDAAFSVRKEIVFDGITISGCGDAWRGIDVFGSGRLRSLAGTSISNACHAIVLKSNSRAEIVSNLFANNGICIEAEGNVQTLGEGIAHNTFYGGNYTTGCTLSNRWAMVLENVPHITIGNMTGGGTPNQFSSYDHGILAVNSNFDMYNTVFEDRPTGTGIRLRGTGSTFTANITGLGNTENDRPFMKALEFGIDAQNYDLTVHDAYFFGAIQHHIKINASPLPTRLVLTENRFEGHAFDAVSVANSMLRSVYIYENTFYDNNSDGLDKSGIRWNTNQMVFLTTPGIPGSIHDNTFYDDAKTSPDPDQLQYQSYGIYINASSAIQIKDNYFYQNYDSDIKHDFKGIWLFNAPRNEMISNGIFGNFGPMISTTPTSFSYRGIDIRESPECFISCNRGENLNEGFYFQGPACDHADFRHNEMSDNLTGLYLAPGSIIGPQEDQENKWLGDLPNNGVAEAHFDGNPGLGQLQMSKFFINSSNSNSTFWADPRIPGTGWFDPSSSPEGHAFLCLKEEVPGPRKSTADDMVIGGDFPAYKAYPASEWDATLNAFANLDKNPELRPANSPEAEFYETHLTANIGKFHRARSAWDNIAAFSAVLAADWEDNAAETAQKLGDIRAENLAMEQATTEAERTQIAQTLETLKSELDLLLQTNQNLSAQYQSDVMDKADELAADLEDITVTETWEENLKTVLEFSVERLLATNGEWTSTQYETLESIAGQCRHEGGIGVVLARSAIEKFDYDDEEICPGWEERSAKSTTMPSVISPNPANDLCRLSFAQPMSGLLTVCNVQGKAIQTRVLTAANILTLTTEKWPSGIYVIHITSGDSAVFSGKLVVAH